MKKTLWARVLTLVVALAMVLSVAACAKDGAVSDSDAAVSASNAQTEPVKVVALSGPTGISMAKLAKDAQTSGEYDVKFVGAPDEITGLLTTKEVDVACVPTNLASVLYNKTEGGVRTVAVTTLGVLYLLDASGEINSLEDLAGKTIGATGQGSNPEYILNYILKGNGLDDVTVNYYSEHAELAALMVSGEIKTAMLPVPFATQVQNKVEGVKVIDLQAEWAKISDTEIAQGVLVCTDEFAQNNPEQLAKLLSDYEASANFANSDVETTAQYVEELQIIASAAMAKQAIPQCNIVCVKGEEMKELVSDFLKVLHEANPKAVGGKLPADDFYVI